MVLSTFTLSCACGLFLTHALFRNVFKFQNWSFFSYFVAVSILITVQLENKYILRDFSFVHIKTLHGFGYVSSYRWPLSARRRCVLCGCRVQCPVCVREHVSLRPGVSILQFERFKTI